MTDEEKKAHADYWKNKPVEQGLDSNAGFLPFDLDQYINLKSLGSKALKKIIGSSAKKAAQGSGGRKLKDRVNDAIKEARANKLKREQVLAEKRAAAASRKDPNKELGTMYRNNTDIKTSDNIPLFYKRGHDR